MYCKFFLPTDIVIILSGDRWSWCGMTGSTAARVSCWWWTRTRAGDDPRSRCGYSRPCEHPHRTPTPPCWPECLPHSPRSRWCWRCSAGGGADCEGRTSWWRSPPLLPISTEVSSMNLLTHGVVKTKRGPM